MKKILFPLLLLFILTGCKEEPKEKLIDESILGKWKVEYSKTLRPADYNKETGEITTYEDTWAIEYFGDYEETKVRPQSGVFFESEIKINLMADNYVDVYLPVRGSYDTDTLRHFYYEIRDGYMLDKQGPDYNPSQIIKYQIKNDSLILESIEQPKTTPQGYTISKYSKITE